MTDRRTFNKSLLGTVIGTCLGTPFIAKDLRTKELPKPLQTRKMKLITTAYKLLTDKDISNYKLMAYGQGYRFCGGPIKDFARDFEGGVATVVAAPIKVNCEIVLIGMSIVDPQGVELIQTEYDSPVKVTAGDILNLTYTVRT